MSTEMLQKRARLLMWLVTVPFALLSILAVMLVGNIAWYGARVAHADLVAIYYFPMLLYMWAIWMVRSALKQVATGALFSHVVPRLLSRVGAALLGGALFTVIGVPLATAWAFGRPHIATFEPSPITLGVVGASLLIFSHLLGGAASMRDELDRFF